MECFSFSHTCRKLLVDYSYTRLFPAFALLVYKIAWQVHHLTTSCKVARPSSLFCMMMPTNLMCTSVTAGRVVGATTKILARRALLMF